MRISSAFAAALLATLFTAAEAAPITYHLTGVESGHVGGTGFADANFDWTITSDTSMASKSGPSFFLPALTSTINIDFPGIGMLTTTVPYEFGADPVDVLFGFLDTTANKGFLFTEPSLLGYDGLSPLATHWVLFGQLGPISTDHGDLTINIDPDQLIAFKVTGGNVPEPASLALVGAGLAGLGALRRRKA